MTRAEELAMTAQERRALRVAQPSHFAGWRPRDATEFEDVVREVFGDTFANGSVERLPVGWKVTIGTVETLAVCFTSPPDRWELVAESAGGNSYRCQRWMTLPEARSEFVAGAPPSVRAAWPGLF